MPDPRLQELRHLAAELRLPVAILQVLIAQAGILPIAESAGEPLYDRLAVAELRHELNKRSAGNDPSST